MYSVHHIRLFWVFALVSVIDLLYFSTARCLLSISILLILSTPPPPPPTQLLFLLSQCIQLCDFATDDILWKRIGGGSFSEHSPCPFSLFIQCVSPQIARNRFYLFHMYPKPSRWTCSVVRLTQFKVILILCVVY